MHVNDKNWIKSELFENCRILDEIFSPNKCDILLDKINHLRNNHQKYKEVTLTKFNYERTYMNYYQFNFFNSVEFFNDFSEAYDFLHNIYVKNGFKSPWNSIKDCHSSESNHYYHLNPQIFE